MSLAAFIASQRTDHRVPHTVACRALGVSESWFYKWKDRPPSTRQQRRAELDAAVKARFDASKGRYGSPRVWEDLVEDGWRVSKNTVAESMARQGLVARPKRRRRGLTRPDWAAPPHPDLIGRDWTAEAPNQRWVGDMTEIATGEGKLYLATVEDLFSRRMLGYAMDEHPDAELAKAAINMAVATRGGTVAGAVFHTDRGSTYTAEAFETACRRLKIDQSMGRVGCALDNAVAESFFSTLEHELRSRHSFTSRAEARAAVAGFIDWYNTVRRHSHCDQKPPITFENEHPSASERARDRVDYPEAA